MNQLNQKRSGKNAFVVLKGQGKRLKNLKKMAKKAKNKKPKNGLIPWGNKGVKLTGGMPMQVRTSSMPAAFGVRTRIGAPQINRGKTFTIRHSEYLDDITPQQTFSLPATQIYALNPGIADNFPWLSELAGNFEQYRWVSLNFRYVARAPTNQSGTVYMTTQLNPADPPFTDKQDMYAYTGTTSGNVWSSNKHNCLLRRGDAYKKYFVRTGALASGQDVQLYDQGNFSWVDISSSTGIQGELIVDYEVEFFNPKRSPSAELGGCLFSSVVPAASIALPYAPIAGTVQHQSFGESYVNGGQSDGRYGNFPAGLYLINIMLEQKDGTDPLFDSLNTIQAATFQPITTSILELIDSSPVSSNESNYNAYWWVKGGDWKLDTLILTTDAVHSVAVVMTAQAINPLFGQIIGMAPPALEMKSIPLAVADTVRRGRNPERKKELRHGEEIPEVNEEPPNPHDKVERKEGKSRSVSREKTFVKPSRVGLV